MASSNFLNDQYLMGILICCMESVFFILNINEISFSDLLNNSEIDVVKLWEGFNDFLRCEMFLPTPLKFHLLDIEIKLVSSYVWKSGSSLLKIIKTFLISEQENFHKLSNFMVESDAEKENKNKINLTNNGKPEKKIKNYPEYDVKPFNI